MAPVTRSMAKNIRSTLPLFVITQNQTEEVQKYIQTTKCEPTKDCSFVNVSNYVETQCYCCSGSNIKKEYYFVHFVKYKDFQSGTHVVCKLCFGLLNAGRIDYFATRIHGYRGKLENITHFGYEYSME